MKTNEILAMQVSKKGALGWMLPYSWSPSEFTFYHCFGNAVWIVRHIWCLRDGAADTVPFQITERDEGALKFLRDIKWSNLEDNKGFKLDFYFEPNPYFKNTLVSDSRWDPSLRVR